MIGNSTRSRLFATRSDNPWVYWVDSRISPHERIGLADIYSQNWPADPAFALWPNPSTEALRDHWERMVRISYDSATQLIELRVLAYAPDQAQQIAQEILAESQKMIRKRTTPGEPL